MTRISILAAVILLSIPAKAHLSCSDLERFERSYGKFQVRNMVLVSISSYITGYISGMAVLGDALSSSIDESVNSGSIEWMMAGISKTKFQTYKDLFFSTGVGSELYNEDNYLKAVDRLVELCRTDRRNTVINLLEEKVIAEMTGS